MKLKNPTCPSCLQPAVGTVENIPAVSTFVGDPRRGAVNYGPDQINWDGQRTVFGKQGQPLVVCVNGHHWETQIDDESAQLSQR